MVRVEEADKLVLSEIKDFGMETVPFESALGRVLAENIKADRDLPPFDRATMDGIAVSYYALGKGIRAFNIKGIQAAGDLPVKDLEQDECIEIMTGAALPPAADTIISYEEIEIHDSVAKIKATPIKKGQNIHFKGKDRKQDEVVAAAGRVIDPVLISMAAS